MGQIILQASILEIWTFPALPGELVAVEGLMASP